ncbi:lectin MOA-related protein [Pseudomonas sp. NPDC007930]|uniref:lectin MOA-related protein n=1 Tax=Pseudomonas sp. NPDC007930 TaxID=3364417 RepID=UPI0036E0CE42
MKLNYIGPEATPPWDQLAAQQIPPPPQRSPEEHDPPAPEPLPQDTAMVLSRALRVRDLSSSDAYVLKDQHGRVLCLHKGAKATWGWAFMAQYEEYYQAVYPITFRFTGNPTDTRGTLSLTVDGQSWAMYANGHGKENEWAFFGASKWPHHPHTKLIARLQRQEAGELPRFALYWNNEDTPLYLAAGADGWNWLKFSASEAALEFSLHKFYVVREKIPALLKATWPNASLAHADLRDDRHCAAVTYTRARAIYEESGLRRFTYKPEVFDCEDFSYVYKAEASKHAYFAKEDLPYAIGLLRGVNDHGGHAVNLFIDPRGELKVLEPQDGRISNAREWEYVPTGVVI